MFRTPKPVIAPSPLPLKRWLPFLLLVLLLHLTLIHWALSPFTLLPPPALDPLVVNAALSLLSPQPLPAIQPKPRRTHKPAPVESPPATALTPDSALDANAAEPSDSSADEPSTSEAPVPTQTPPDAPKPPISLGKLPHYSVNPAPSAELVYKAHSLTKGQDIYGTGRILWQSSGNAFKVKGEFNILFLSLLNFSSDGSVNPDHGLTPTVYAEKRMRRAETATHFHPERKTISFSASSLVYDRPGGEQDRASIVWQLVGIARKSGGSFTPGATLQIAVAGIRHADVWKIRIVGIEEVDTGIGTQRAWRLSRKAASGSYEQSLDVWLAPGREWYPVKLRYTKSNGDYLDLSLSEINKAP